MTNKLADQVIIQKENSPKLLFLKKEKIVFYFLILLIKLYKLNEKVFKTKNVLRNHNFNFQST